MAATQRTIELATADGHTLAADLALPERPGGPIGSVVICHPHPRYGGNRFNPVVETIFGRAADSGLAALRFDFRGDHGGGIAERADLVAAIDEVERHANGPTFVVGYSFGAAVALATADDRLAGLVAVAPPLAVMEVGTPTVPTLVIAPAHDQITDVEVVAETVAAWPDAHLEVLASADHFLAGHIAQVADLTLAWLLAR